MLGNVCELEYQVQDQERTPLEKNWEDLKSTLLDLAEFRVHTSKAQWYQEAYMYYKVEIDAFNPRCPSEVNCLPKGIIAEAFFLDACRRNGLECFPSLGEEDVLGADFRITNDKETRFFDVTVNTSHRGFFKKVREGRFPTLFLPWEENQTNNGYRRSYAERFLRDGDYDSKEYIENTLRSNYFILDKLRRAYWRNQRIDEEILGKTNLDLSRAGLMYIKDLDGVLKLIRKSLN